MSYIIIFCIIKQGGLTIPAPIKFAYIGLTDRVQEMMFVWIDGTALTYADWGLSKPSDVDGTKNVVVVKGPHWGAFGKWIDARENAETLICEKPARSIPGEII